VCVCLVDIWENPPTAKCLTAATNAPRPCTINMEKASEG
jgi:hypothetical protein